MADSKKTDGGASEAAAKSPRQQFQLQKIYLKDTSFETPNSPAIFKEKWEPTVNVDLQTSGKPLAADVYEVVLSVTVTVKLGEKSAYLVEVHQAGVFSASGFAEDELGQLLGSYCPGILFPYAREAVSAMVSKGGFPQFLLTPVNFDIMYAQHKQKLAAQAASDAPMH